jgi:undecaprenyl diphosphate synthase
MMDGIEMATVYAFSTENWNRDPLEVSTLMTIFAKYAETFVTEALKHNVRVNVLSTGAFSLCLVLFFYLDCFFLLI